MALRLRSALRRSGSLLRRTAAKTAGDARHLATARPLEALLPTHVRNLLGTTPPPEKVFANRELRMADVKAIGFDYDYTLASYTTCLLYTSPSPRDRQKSRMPSSA